MQQIESKYKSRLKMHVSKNFQIFFISIIVKMKGEIMKKINEWLDLP